MLLCPLIILLASVLELTCHFIVLLTSYIILFGQFTINFTSFDMACYFVQFLCSLVNTAFYWLQGS